MRLYLRSADRRPDPPPLESNDRAVVLFGIVVWAVLLVVALALRSRLEAQGRGWWMWTPVVAIGLGLYGLRYIRRRDERRNGTTSTGRSRFTSTGRSRFARRRRSSAP